MFKVWMDILKAKDDSILWLLETEDIAKNISPRTRLSLLTVSAALFVILTNYSIKDLGFGYFDNFLHFYLIGLFFSAFAICGVTNSINIIDGFLLSKSRPPVEIKTSFESTSKISLSPWPFFLIQISVSFLLKF